jgi:hypothetical protein
VLLGLQSRSRPKLSLNLHPSAHTTAHLHTQAQIDEGPNVAREGPDVPTKKAKKDPNAPKRSPTAWMLFRTATTPSVKEENPGEWCTWHFGVPVSLARLSVHYTVIVHRHRLFPSSFFTSILKFPSRPPRNHKPTDNKTVACSME